MIGSFLKSIARVVKYKVGVGRLVLFGMTAFGCAVVASCKDGADVILASCAQSPNGSWVAEAKTQQWGGPGGGYVATTVTLNWIQGPKRQPIEILELSNESAYPPGVTRVAMRWVTNSHLDVAYGEGAKVNFQAIKAAGLDITSHSSSSDVVSLKADSCLGFRPR